MNELGRRHVLLGLATAVLMAGCGSTTDGEKAAESRPLTGAEAELLALTRYRLHQEGQVGVSMSWPGEPDTTLDVTLDLTAPRAFGSMRWTADGGARVDRLIGWNLSAIATAPAVPSGSPAPGRAAWSTRALSTAVGQDLFLALALTLGSDRPENPVLIRQGSARFLRHDSVDGTAVSVYSGPRPADQSPGTTSGTTSGTGARTRYWVDDDGELRRFEAYLGDSGGRFAQITRSAGAPDVRGLAARITNVLRIGAAGKAS